jgi:hypothetical protein
MGRRLDSITCRHCRGTFRAISVSHLRAHGYTGKHPVYAYMRRFRLGKSVCVDTSHLHRAASFRYWRGPKCPGRWRRDSAIAWVRKRLHNPSALYAFKAPPGLQEFVRRRMGKTWAQFIESFGIPYRPWKMPPVWTRTRVLAAIRRLHRKGRILRRKKVPLDLYDAGGRRFGSWKAAVEAAGLDYERATGLRRWTRDKVVAEIRKLAAEGAALQMGRVKRRHSALFAAAEKLISCSWAESLRAAGIDPALHTEPRGRRRLTAEKVRTLTQQRIDGGRSLLAQDVPLDILNFVRRKLRTNWTAYVESFGIPYPGPKKRRDWTKEAVLDEIRRRRARGGRLNVRAVQDERVALLRQAEKFFGNWDAACIAAGIGLQRLRRKAQRS